MNIKDDNILQNLKDADCPKELIEEFFRMKEAGLNNQLVQLLYTQKTRLLESLHESQKKVDCLDYLIFQINRSIAS